MKINFNYIKIVLVFGLVILLYGFAEKRNSVRKINDVEVRFTQIENLYVTEEAVNKLLIQNDVGVTGIDKETIDLNRVEGTLNDHPMIENAEVFLTLDGILKTTINQRRPIGRILASENFYVDRLGDKMPLSPYYSARVPVLVGISDEDLEEVFPLLDYIYNDEFLTEHITAVVKLEESHYSLELRKMDFHLVFGKIDRVEGKFNNFKAFYKKAQKDEILNTYKMVDLQYGNQVVCTKK